MNLPLVFRVEAESEFDDAVDFYESQQAGLGDRFVIIIQAVLDRIALNPQLYPIIAPNTRRAVTNQFPYCVFYRLFSDRIEVVAIVHSSRDPKVWQRRL